MKAFPDINWELDKIQLFNPYSSLMDDDSAIDSKNQEDIECSPRIVDRSDSNLESLV